MKKVQEPARSSKRASHLLPRSRWVKMTTATIVPALFIAGGIMAAVNPSMWEVQNQDTKNEAAQQPIAPPKTTTLTTVDKPAKTEPKKGTETTDGTTQPAAHNAHQNVVTKRHASAEKQRTQTEKTDSQSEANDAITRSIDRFRERLLGDSRLLPLTLGN